MKKEIRNGFALGVAMLFVISCEEETPNKQNELTQLTFSEFQTEILNKSCVSGCHSAKVSLGNLDLSEGNSYLNMINKSSFTDSSKLLINPKNSKESYLIHTLIGTGDAKLMPPSPLKLISKTNIQRIANWIIRGAPND